MGVRLQEAFVKHSALVSISAAGLMVASAHVEASAPVIYPVKPIRVIVATTPGGPPDVVARLIGEKLAAGYGQPVIVDNRPGAGGSIGMGLVAKAAADGYTLAVAGMPFIAVTPRLLGNLPFDTQKDFAPITLIAWNYNVLVVPAVSPMKSVEQLLEMAKAKPGVLRFSSGGNGTPAHLASELLKREARIDIVHIPYKGAAAGVSAMLSSDADMMIGAVGAVTPHIRSGRLRALATSAPHRIAAYPELPTFVELGYPNVQIRDWQSIVAPAATPSGVIANVHAEVMKAIGMTDVRHRLESLGMEVAGAGPTQARDQIRVDVQRWGRLIRDIGIRAD
jgi:tripartite-type tricarboxylate transporter receptor subunit TctC